MKAHSRSVTCSKTPLWDERVERVPRSWFEALTENARRLPLDELPFGRAEREHLAECAACREAALDALEQRALWRWELLCPQTSEITDWLRGNANAPLEAHLCRCALCAAQTKRTAWLAHGAGLLTREQVEAKLRVFAPAGEPRLGLWAAFVGWLVEHFWLTEEGQSVVAGWRLLFGGRRATRPNSRAELVERLAGADSLTLGRSAEGVRWLLAQRHGDQVVVQAGASAAEKWQSFRLVFRRGDTLVHAVETRVGRLWLTPDDFNRAAAARADGFEIESTEG